MISRCSENRWPQPIAAQPSGSQVNNWPQVCTAFEENTGIVEDNEIQRKYAEGEDEILDLSLGLSLGFVTFYSLQNKLIRQSRESLTQ